MTWNGQSVSRHVVQLVSPWQGALVVVSRALSPLLTVCLAANVAVTRSSTGQRVTTEVVSLRLIATVATKDKCTRRRARSSSTATNGPFNSYYRPCPHKISSNFVMSYWSIFFNTGKRMKFPIKYI